MHESNEALRHLQAIEDRSHLINETWSDLGHNLLLTFIVAVTAWVLTSLLLLSIQYTHTYLFKAFKQPSSYRDSLNNLLVILCILVGGGIMRDILLRFSVWHNEKGDGVSSALKAFYQAYQEQLKGTPNPNTIRYKKPMFTGAIRRIILTFLTVGTGGSGGLEGPVIPVGEAIASGWACRFKVTSPDNLRVLQMSGISAAFATLLNAPYMSAIFAAEIVFSDRLIYRPLFYSLIAAIVAHFGNNYFLHTSPLFTFHPHAQFYTPIEYFYASLVAILISAPAGLGLRLLFEKLKQIVKLVPSSIQATTGALLTGSVALIVWLLWHISPEHILGVGEETLSAIYEGSGDIILQNWYFLLIILLAKAVTTGFTLMAGGSAGLLIPAMFMGGTSGAIVYYLMVNTLGIHTSLLTPEILIVSGVAASLVAVIEVPIAAIAFVLEGFGATLAPPAIAGCVICYLIVKRLRLYTDPTQMTS